MLRFTLWHFTDSISVFRQNRLSLRYIGVRFDVSDDQTSNRDPLTHRFPRGINHPAPRPFWIHGPPRNRRLDAALYSRVGSTCFFTIRAAKDGRPFESPKLAAIACELLLRNRDRYGCQVDAYVVMPNHAHVLVTPFREASSSLTFIDRFKGVCSYELHKAGLEGPVWQDRYYDHLLREKDRPEEFVEYMLNNPVRAGLCDLPDEYRWAGIPKPIGE